MRQQLLRQISVGKTDNLSYFLLETAETIDTGEMYTGYGIRVLENDQCTDCPDISPCLDYTKNLLHRLADSGVYPVHLRDVVSDILS